MRPWFIKEGEVVPFAKKEKTVVSMPNVASYPNFLAGVEDLQSRVKQGTLSDEMYKRLYTDLLHRFMRRESAETPWFMVEATAMADKIFQNKKQLGSDLQSGDVFLNLLQNNPEELIDKKTGQSVNFPKKNDLLKIAKDYQKKYKKSITSDQNEWPKTLMNLGFTKAILNRLTKTDKFGASEKEKFAKQIQPAAIFKGSAIDQNELKSIDIAIANNSIPGKDLVKTIINSPVLKNPKNQLGNIVIQIAKNLQMKNNKLPQGDWMNDNNAVNAIQDYAGEYLGVIALINGIANFPNLSAFLSYMNAKSLIDLSYYFPSKTNQPLADSFGYIKNKQGTAIMNISSKGGTSGAAPSLSNLKISQKTRSKKEYAEEISFIDTLMESKNEFESAFRLYNVLYNLGSDARKGLTEASKGIKLNPFTDDQIANLNAIYKNRGKTIPKQEIQAINKIRLGTYLQQLQKSNPDTAVKDPVGFIFYFTQKIVLDAVNKHNALPDFQPLVREVLGDNFMQIITKLGKDSISVNVLYPAKVNGQVVLWSKSSQSAFKGKLGFKILPTKGYFN